MLLFAHTVEQNSTGNILDVQVISCRKISGKPTSSSSSLTSIADSWDIIRYIDSSTSYNDDLEKNTWYKKEEAKHQSTVWFCLKSHAAPLRGAAKAR